MDFGAIKLLEGVDVPFESVQDLAFWPDVADVFL